MISEKDSVRRDRNTLASALREAGANFVRPNAIKCPFHDDRHASGDIHAGGDGIFRFKCHAAGCGFYGDVFDVRAKMTGGRAGDLLREFRHMHDTKATGKSEPPPRRFASVKAMIYELRADHAHRYTNPTTGKDELVILRVENADGKRFLQARPDGDGFVLKAPESPLPIYNRAGIISAPGVIVVEGEKCADALIEIGLIATTSPGGAGKAAMADWSPLAGKIVMVWPDNDPPNPPDQPKPGARTGIDHMRDVVRELQKLEPPPQIYWIDPDKLNLPSKGDVVDFLELYAGDCDTAGKSATVKVVVDGAESISVADELHRLFEDTISGKRRAVDWPHKYLSQFSKALMPGALTVVCADPSAGKSFYALDCAVFWLDRKERFDILFLEDSRAYYLNRAIAQWDNNADLTDDKWIKDHPDEARQAMAKHRVKIAEFGRRIHCRNGDQFTIGKVLDWIRDRAVAGSRVIAIDPITAAIGSDKPWLDDQKFISDCEQLAVQHGCSIVLFTHRNKGKKSLRGSLDEMAGGAAYQRFCHSVIWIAVPEKPKRVLVVRPTALGNERQHVTVNRIIQIRKARSGRGTGMELAFHFDPRSLSFVEMGLIVKDEGGDYDESV